MKPVLKPCPFCESDDLSVHLDDGFSYYVWCGNCGSQTDNDHLTEKEAIKAWNTRPAEDELKAEVERLKEELDARKSVTKIAYSDIKWLCEEVEKWKKMFYDLDDKYAKVLIEISRKRGER